MSSSSTMRIVTREISFPWAAARRMAAYQSTSALGARTSKVIVRPSESALVTISAPAAVARAKAATKATRRVAHRRRDVIGSSISGLPKKKLGNR